MTDRPVFHTASSAPVSESLQRLTHFARDLGSLTALPLAAARILSELSEITRHDQGALYIVDREHHQYRRQASIGTSYVGHDCAAISADHPLIHRLAESDDLCSPLHPLHDDSAGPEPSGQPWSISLALPLKNRSQLAAFVLFPQNSGVDQIDPAQAEWLHALTQIAANAVDALLVHDDLAQSQTLMRRTDRLRSLEIIAGGFAHEIRNPLTSIKTFIQLAPERKNDTEFIRDFSRIVLEDVYRIERLIQEILDYARYMEPKLTEEDLNEIAASCLYFIEVKAESRRIKIEKELASGLPRVMLDRQQIKQVLLNLLLNAMDAMGEHGGSLRVRTSRFAGPDGSPWVHAEVEDTGHGISLANLEHIFDPFFTTKHASDEREGTGLGLTIAHQIIQEHRGTLNVTSTEGVGTTFFIDLPAVS